ncbi:unnamed protein product, partial [Musa acuminata var. zebrina]
ASLGLAGSEDLVLCPRFTDGEAFFGGMKGSVEADHPTLF